MPRVSRVKAKNHATAAQLPKRTFAADGKVEHVLPGSNLDATIADISQPAEPEPSSSKKAFSGADSVPTSLSTQPYSKSHRKRLNRQVRENHLSGGQLHPLAAALAESLGQKNGDDKKARVRSKLEKEKERMDEEKKKREDGKIGEGRGKTLGERKRRDLISEEAKRRDAVMNHVQFKSDPWATIRMHAGNSLAVKDIPKAVKKAKGTNGPAKQVRMDLD